MFSEGHARLQPHHLSGLIDRLSNRLGHTRVMRVRLIPDAQPELACHYAPLVWGHGIKGSDYFFPSGPEAGRRIAEVAQNIPDPFDPAPAVAAAGAADAAAGRN